MTPFSYSLDCSDEPFPNVPNHDGPEALLHVRKSNEALSAMSYEELQAYILDCAEQFLAAHRRYEETGCFACVGERDAWWIAEAAALRERGSRPEVVARMEQERGLA